MAVSTSDTYVIAIDLGTGGPKVALFSVRGECLGHEFEDVPLLLFPNGGAEQRTEDWWAAIKKATARLLDRVKVPADRIAALSCTAQWSGTVAVDRDGSALMNAIIWMDSRGAPYIRDITKGVVAFEGYGVGKAVKWLRLTGGIPAHSGKDPIAHILYIKHELPEIYRRTYKFLEPKDYINLRLTGRYAASYDSIALHWVTDNRNLARVVYNDDLIRLSTIDAEKLPELKRAVDILGPITPEVARELGLPAHVKVVMGTPDLQSAAIGSGAVRDYEAHLYIGTSSWLICHVPFKKVDALHNMTTLPSAIPGRYFVANEQETAGACLKFLRDNLLFHRDELETGQPPEDVFKVFDAIVERVPAGSNRVIFTPWLYGERTPVENRLLRAGFTNLSLETTREQMIRAVFEGVAYNARWLLMYVEKFIKRPLEAIRMIGGGANSNVWCQILADVLGRPIQQVQDPILANARGAAFLAGLGLGHLRVEDIPDRVKIAATYTPEPRNRALYDELFREFLALYRSHKKIYGRLNATPRERQMER
jgi:xylulokinase